MKSFILNAAKLGLEEGPSISLRNIWEEGKLGLNELVEIPAKGVIFIAVNQ